MSITVSNKGFSFSHINFESLIAIEFPDIDILEPINNFQLQQPIELILYFTSQRLFFNWCDWLIARIVIITNLKRRKKITLLNLLPM